MTRARAVLLLVLVATAAYGNSLGNGYAYDDNEIVLRNPAVTEGDFSAALGGPYWPQAADGGGLYRPVTILSFTAEWAAFGDSPLAFHAGNVVFHAIVTVLVFALVGTFVGLPGGVVGGLLFAVHPVHTEAVANIVGRGEIYAAMFYLAACLLYLRGAAWGAAGRGARLAGIAGLYLLGLGSKEIAVTLPGALLLLEAFRTSSRPLRERLRDELPVYAVLPAVLAIYLTARHAALGSITGEIAAPVFQGLDAPLRVLTGISLWSEYLRLMIFPLDLAADYGPAVLFPAQGVDGEALLGLLVIGGLGVAALAFRRTAGISLGILWFGLAVLPVSNLFFSTGVLLAERTLYLPSVGLCLAAGGVAATVSRLDVRPRRSWAAAATVAALLLMGRTIMRNPSWLDSYTVLNTLALEHPESHLALRARGSGLDRAGDREGAALAFDAAVGLAPGNYALLTEVAEFYGRHQVYDRADEILRRAIPIAPYRPTAYRLLSEYLIEQRRYREGHRVALDGLERSGPDRQLWALLSEAYVARGDLPAAIRARQAALAQDSGSKRDWGRLAELFDANDDEVGAEAARARQAALEDRAEGPS